MGTSQTRHLRRAILAVTSGSKPKRFCWISKLAEHVAAEGLVAGLHVGERQAGRQVRGRRQQAVAQPVQRASGLAAARRETASHRPRRPAPQTIGRPAAGCRAGRIPGRRPARRPRRRVTRRKPVRRAAPLPSFCGLKITCTSRAASYWLSSCRVPSVLASSTTMISLGIGSAATRASTVLDRPLLVIDRDHDRQLEVPRERRSRACAGS